MKAMILAAGLGTRMRPLTDNCPKPLLDVAGKPLIVRHLEKLKAASVSEVVINVSYLGEMIEAALKDGSELGLRIHYSREVEPLETAGGILKALPVLGDAVFWLVNGDMWLDGDYDLLPRQLPDNTDMHLVLVDNPEHNPEGDFALADTRARLKAPAEIGLTFSGLSALHPRLFDAWREHTGRALALRDVLRPAIADQRVSAHHCQRYWLDVGTPARLNELAEKLAAEEAR